MATAGTFPIELADIKRHPVMVVKEAPAVTIPDGISGRIRDRIISMNTCMGELFFTLLKIV